MSNANPSIGVEVIVTLDMAKDICEALGLGNVSQAISRLDDDEKGVKKIYTLGGEQNILHINESGLYSLTIGLEEP